MKQIRERTFALNPSKPFIVPFFGPVRGSDKSRDPQKN